MLIMHIGFLACFHAISLERSRFSKIATLFFLLVSLISRLEACSARIDADKQTNRQTHRTTTVTLAAHARRGLINPIQTMYTIIIHYDCLHAKLPEGFASNGRFQQLAQ